jgi:hypothetical protein
MWCKVERRDVPDAELRQDDTWGWVHQPDEGKAHTVNGSYIYARPSHVHLPDRMRMDDSEE